jgi:hypothetical protein
MKKYPALVDVYYRTYTQDPESGGIISTWHYDDPTTYECNFMSLKGHAEQFGETYAQSDTVKLEVRPRDAEYIDLSMRFGNLRMKNEQTENYYRYVGDRTPGEVIDYVFNIDGMNPQVDNNGRIVAVEIFGFLAGVA